MKFQVFFKNKETQQEELGEANLRMEDIACFYKDQYGVFVVTHGGRTYKVNNTLKELEELL